MEGQNRISRTSGIGLAELVRALRVSLLWLGMVVLLLGVVGGGFWAGNRDLFTRPTTPAGIFAEAKSIHVQALERLEAGDIRAASEGSWRAASRAADALVLAKTGREPQKAPETLRELRRLSLQDTAFDPLVSKYSQTRDILHGDCYYLAQCQPVEDTRRRIRETAIYIGDAESLAQGP